MDIPFFSSSTPSQSVHFKLVKMNEVVPQLESLKLLMLIQEGMQKSHLQSLVRVSVTFNVVSLSARHTTLK